MSPNTTAGTERSVDFTLMYTAHEAFRRDLRRLERAAESGALTDPGVVAGWNTLRQQLDMHHVGEDVTLWPLLRGKATAPDDAGVIDAMESEHQTIELLIGRVNSCLACEDRAGLRETVGFLSVALNSHVEHEEREALPLVARLVGDPGWRRFTRYMSKAQGLRGAAVFSPGCLRRRPRQPSRGSYTSYRYRFACCTAGSGSRATPGRFAGTAMAATPSQPLRERRDEGES
jgi:hypothetical protein